METLLIGQATEEQLKQWKQEIIAKYGDTSKLFAYEVDALPIYLRSVDRNTYALGTAKVMQNPAKFNEVIIENIWMGGDETLRKNDEYYYGLIEYVEELMTKKKGSLKQL